MRKPAVPLTVLALGIGLAVTPAPSLAASAEGDQFGNTCVANEISEDVTRVAVAGDPADGLPATAPRTGVITRVAIAFPSEAGVDPYPQKVKVVRPAATPGEYVVVAESASLPTGYNRGPFEVRVPVEAGDLLGIGGEAGAVRCIDQSEADELATFLGDVPVGAPAAPVDVAPGMSLPVVATIEPDSDKDGFGDVSQDLCPQSAAQQAACPRIGLDTFAVGQGNTILALVTADRPAEVTVAGTIKVGGKKLKLRSKAKAVRPGRFTRFTLRLPAPLKKALAALPASRSIAVKITATAPQLGTKKKARDTATVRLRGTR